VRLKPVFVMIPLFFLAACGGGGGGSDPSADAESSGSNSSGSGSSGTGSPVSGSSGSSGGVTIASAAANVATLTIDKGPSGASGVVNTPYVTITVCAPGSTTACQTIDHIEVDTGSYGLRIISTVLNQSVLSGLTKVTTASTGTPIAECTMFGDGYSWGSVRLADLTISGEKASSLPMQIIGDPAVPNIPRACSNTGRQENTVATFGANGIIGVGPFVQDCGQACVQSSLPGFYYSCPTDNSACSPTVVTLTQEVTNPVSWFPTDNNGVIIQLPPISDNGALTVTGALVFGIDTQSNNALGSADVVTADKNYGYISVTFGQTSYPHSFIDSGSNLYYFNTNAQESVEICSFSNQAFYCPASQVSLSAVNVGANDAQSIVTFKVGKADSVFTNNPTHTAFNNVAAPNSDPKGVDYGLPFFFGKAVYTAISGRNTSGGMGPYFAY
jgi:hypothetical protein